MPLSSAAEFVVRSVQALPNRLLDGEMGPALLVLPGICNIRTRASWPSFSIDFSDSPSPNLFGIAYRVIEPLKYNQHISEGIRVHVVMERSLCLFIPKVLRAYYRSGQLRGSIGLKCRSNLIEPIELDEMR